MTQFVSYCRQLDIVMRVGLGWLRTPTGVGCSSRWNPHFSVGMDLSRIGSFRSVPTTVFSDVQVPCCQSWCLALAVEVNHHNGTACASVRHRLR